MPVLILFHKKRIALNVKKIELKNNKDVSLTLFFCYSGPILVKC